MVELLLPPDIEAAVVAYLAPLLPGAWVGTRRPFGTDWQSAPADIVRVSVVDGDPAKDLVLDVSLLAVEVWAADSVTAATRAGRVSALLDAWSGQQGAVLVYQCEATRPRSAPDPLTRNPRYLVTASVTARRVGAIS